MAQFVLFGSSGKIEETFVDAEILIEWLLWRKVTEAQKAEGGVRNFKVLVFCSFLQGGMNAIWSQNVPPGIFTVPLGRVEKGKFGKGDCGKAE